MRLSHVFGALLSVISSSLAASCDAVSKPLGKYCKHVATFRETRTDMDQNNCYRAVLGAGAGVRSSHIADCSSNIRCTATPDPVTSTVTQTVTPADAVVVDTTSPPAVSAFTTATPLAATTTQTVSPSIFLVTVTVTPTPATTTVTVSQFQSFAKRQKPTESPASDGATITMSPVEPIAGPPPTVQRPVVVCRVATPSYASACSGAARYVSACSCIGVTATTTTVSASTAIVTTTTTLGQQTVTSFVTITPQTSTVTVTLPQQTSTVTATLVPTCTVMTILPQQTATTTVAPALPTQCNNAGLQWAYYPDNQVSFNKYEPALVKQEAPMVYGVTPYVGVANRSGDPHVVYSSGKNLPGTNYVLNHRGYLYAPESGTYTSTLSRVDDIVNIWIGSLAYSGWNRSNAFQQFIIGDNPASGVRSIQLTAGKYYPFRLTFKQSPDYASFVFSFVSPSGTTLIDSDPNFQPSPYFVQYSCDGNLAPSYPSFGQET